MLKHGRRRTPSKGFTLLELVVVIVILAILAGLAVPRYMRTVNRSRSNEALQTLGYLRESAERYYARYSSYSGIANDFGNLDFSPTDVSGTASWTYAASGQAAEAYTFTATYTAGAASDKVTLSKAAGGAVTITGAGQFSGI